MKTQIAALQEYLERLVTLIDSGNRESFVRAFVPTDLTEADLLLFLGDLTSGSDESESQWLNLSSEIRAIASGEKTSDIQVKNMGKQAIFFFEHPLMDGCDREVVFVFEGGEWRAEG